MPTPITDKEFERLITESMERRAARFERWRHGNETEAFGLYVGLFQFKYETRCPCEEGKQCEVTENIGIGDDNLTYSLRVSYAPTLTDLEEVKGLSCPA